MKILVQKTRTNQNQPKFQVPLNPKAMDVSKAVACDQYITIPYADQTLLHDESVQEIVTHIAEQTDWIFPDYEATKFNLVFEVNEDFEANEKLDIISAALQVIAQPPVYTEQDKEDILNSETDDEMYITWQEIFYHAEDYYKNEDQYFEGSYDEVDVEFDEDEISAVKTALYNVMVVY